MPRTVKKPKRNVDKTKERIRKVAFEIFAKKGFASTSTRMIAKKAKLNIALISRYFGGKEQLFKHIVQMEFEKISRNDLNYPAKDSLRDEIENYLDSIFKNISSNKNFFHIVLSQSLVDRRFFVFFKEALLSYEDVRLLPRLKHLKEIGAIPKHLNPLDINQTILAFVAGHAIYSFVLLGKKRDDLNENIESFLKILCGEV